MTFCVMPSDHGELVDGLERTVLVAIRDDGLGLGGTDAVERLGERGGVGGVDVDRLGQRNLRQQQRGGESGKQMSEFHGASLR